MATNKALESVLEELLAAEGDVTAETLEAWLRKYPQYRQDIVEFVSEWRLQKHLPEEAANVDAHAIAAQVLAGLHEELVRRDDREVPFLGIFVQAQKLGLRLENEVAELGVNLHLLDMLDKKRVRPDTVPPAFLGALAARVQVSAGKLHQWLSEGAPTRRPATIMGALSFRRPTVLSFEKAWKQSGLPTDALKDWTGTPAARK
ncbi:MAG TPA: hypothetical protein VN929_03410 [Burkholderiales bacterium]|nr:hypothetical protein [Burkholderiales bacterium]